MKSIMRWLTLAILVAGIPASTFAQATLVPAGSTWNYLADGSNQDTAWRAEAFDDSLWSSGAAQLGYGDGGEATVINCGPSAPACNSGNFITTYFRKDFNVANPGAYAGLTIRLVRDDGAVVYLNGNELARDVLPAFPAAIAFDTPATAAIGGADESTFYTYNVSAAGLQAGNNTLAVEIHQSGDGSSDISFDLELLGTQLQVTRGPYLQMGTPQSVVVRWKTNAATNSRVSFGTVQGTLDQNADDAASTIDHSVTLSGLAPDTRYYYAVGSTSGSIAGNDATHFFVTSPNTGTRKPTRIWVLGDSGTANANAAAVRTAYYNFTGARHTDLWLMLGDNAYSRGMDSEYQAAVFNMYPDMLRKSVLWPTFGNHDAGNPSGIANSANQTGPYYDIFTLPKAAEAGGLASGTEAYYSFDYGNIHFICMNSMDVSRAAPPAGVMMSWLQNDLAATAQEWIIAFWHHPPYTKGSHNSDTESELVQMRQVALPILEAGGVDLVLAGHSHCYERSYLLNGHYGVSSTLTAAMKIDDGNGKPDEDGEYRKPSLAVGPNEGAVYAVAGSSGQISGGSLNHPAMFVSLNVLGSMALDIDGAQMDATFIDNVGNIRDYFTIRKGPDTTPTPTATASSTESPTPTATLYDGRPFGDLDNSGCTDIGDFLILLDTWQTDLNGTLVSLDDFLKLLDFWQSGPTCP